MVGKSFKEKIKDLIALETDESKGLKNNPVANFSYTSKAYSDDNAQGVESYEFAQDQNIPVATTKALDTNGTVLTKGYRSQGASISRMLVNHFFGRTSYNLNKIHDWFSDFLSIFLDDFLVHGVWDLTLESYTSETDFDTMTTPGARKGKNFTNMTHCPDTIEQNKANFLDWECVVVKGNGTYRQLLFYLNNETKKTYMSLRTGTNASVGIKWETWATSSDYAENSKLLDSHPAEYFAVAETTNDSIDTLKFDVKKAKEDIDLIESTRPSTTSINGMFRLGSDNATLFIEPLA